MELPKKGEHPIQRPEGHHSWVSVLRLFFFLTVPRIKADSCWEGERKHKINYYYIQTPLETRR